MAMYHSAGLLERLMPCVSKKMFLALTLNFEAVATLMSGILVFSVFPDLYNLFDTLLICFHGLISEW